MMGDYQVRFCERFVGETPTYLLGGNSNMNAIGLSVRN
jgi:hypothetical protein